MLWGGGESTEKGMSVGKVKGGRMGSSGDEEMLRIEEIEREKNLKLWG